MALAPLSPQRIAKYPTSGYHTSVIAHASANTKGSYVELVTTAPFDACALRITGSTNGSVSYLIDIAIGAATSEQIIVANYHVSYMNINDRYDDLFPINIPAGVRIAIRCQATTGGAATLMTVQLFSATHANPGFARSVTYGAGIGDSGGTDVDAGAVLNTKGSYAEISAAMGMPTQYLVMCLDDRVNTAPAEITGDIDLAIGAATSEQIIVPDCTYYWDANGDFLTPRSCGFFIQIPEGVRLAARQACGTTDANDRIVSLLCIGFA